MTATPGTAGTIDAGLLMGRYCDGDARAFRAFYDLCAPGLLQHLLRQTSDRALAESLLHGAFQELHARRSAYVRGADPVPWLHEIASLLFERERRRNQPGWLRRHLFKSRDATVRAPLPAWGYSGAPRRA
jgi:RNA polymerase sigma-70 factor (ECF subfamily)